MSLKDEIREGIEMELIEQDRQNRDDIGMMNERGLSNAVERIMELIKARENLIHIGREGWKRIGENKEGEDIYENQNGVRATEKDHQYLVKEEG